MAATGDSNPAIEDRFLGALATLGLLLAVATLVVVVAQP